MGNTYYRVGEYNEAIEINNRIKLKKILDIFHNKNLQTNVFKDLQNDNRVVEIYK